MKQLILSLNCVSVFIILFAGTCFGQTITKVQSFSEWKSLAVQGAIAEVVLYKRAIQFKKYGENNGASAQNNVELDVADLFNEVMTSENKVELGLSEEIKDDKKPQTIESLKKESEESPVDNPKVVVSGFVQPSVGEKFNEIERMKLSTKSIDFLNKALEQAQFRLTMARELSLKEYFSVYLMGELEGSKESIKKAVSQLSQEELTELLIEYGEVISKSFGRTEAQARLMNLPTERAATPVSF